MSGDGLYYYGVTFWSLGMANETSELLYTAYDSEARAGALGCYTVTLPAEMPAPATGEAAVAKRLAHRKVRIPYRR